jgi:predicted ferric reductase
VDWILRLTIKGPNIYSATAEDVGGVTKITAQLSKPLDVGPGEYFFLTCPEISSIQSHPFSVSSQPKPNVLTFHVKRMGNETSFTSKLLALAKAQKSLDLKLEGPYGRFSVALGVYSDIWLVAGGIGITPMMSTLLWLRTHAHERLPSLKSVHLVWSVRYEDELSWFQDELSKFESKSPDGEKCEFHLHIYVTRFSKAKKSTSLNSVTPKETTFKNPMVSERGGPVPFQPDVRPAYGELLSIGAQDGVVLACGPPAMVASARDAATTRGMDFHEETFLF